MNIENIRLEDLHPYERNPRKNDAAVEPVAESIRQFGFRVPIIIDRNNEIIAGHTRLKAAELLGMTEVPCIRADDLTDEQVMAFRLADNRVAEFAEWDPKLLDWELSDLKLEDIDMSAFGFEVKDWFQDRERFAGVSDDDDEEYKEFVEKFEQKHTTDDCYTPDLVYEAIADWVAKEYGLDRKKFVRPFYPGGDYQNEHYPEGCIVVDNPPFSILTEIVAFYQEKGQRFFLFCPALTPPWRTGASLVAAQATIVYENGASVRTAFVTDLEPENVRMRTVPELHRLIEAAMEEVLKKKRVELRKHAYPPEVITAAMLDKIAKFETLVIRKESSYFIRELDAQKESGAALYGSGFLLSEGAAQEKAAAEKAAAEKAAAERWTLSEREWEIVRSLK